MSSTMSISRREFARLCGVSHTHINNLIREGKLPLNEYGIPIPEAFFQFEKTTGRKLPYSLMNQNSESNESIIEKIDPFLYELDLLPERLAAKLHACETVEEVQSMLDKALQKLIKEHIESIDD